MKKLLLGIVLLALLAGVSYIKSVRDSARRTEAFDRGRKAARYDSVSVAKKVDSLEALIAETENQLSAQRSALTDSLDERDCLMAELSDSLGSLIAARDSLVASLHAEADPGEGSASPSTKQGVSSEHEILAHYSKAVKKLPSDLSAYERAVAIREIKQETARKFAITVDRLDEIRQTNNLDY